MQTPIKHQCKAHLKSGRQCKRRAILGGKVCPMHGGSAPQVKRKAQERIDAAADSLVAAVVELALGQQTRDGRPVEAKDIIAAAKELLNRSSEVRQPGVEVKHSGDPSGVALPAYHALLEIARQRIQELEHGGINKGRVIASLEDAIDVEYEEEE